MVCSAWPEILVELGAAITSVASNPLPARNKKALGFQQIVGGRQDLGHQLVLFEQVAQPQDGALTGQAVIPAAQARKVPTQRSIAGPLAWRDCSG